MKTFLACEQVVHLGDSREVTWELQAKRNVGARGFTARSSVLSQLASLAIIGELSRRLENAIMINGKTIKHMIANLPLVTFVITNLTRLTIVVYMTVRFKAKVIRGFSVSRCYPTRSCAPVSRISLISRVIFPWARHTELWPSCSWSNPGQDGFIRIIF